MNGNLILFDRCQEPEKQTPQRLPNRTRAGALPERQLKEEWGPHSPCLACNWVSAVDRFELGWPALISMGERAKGFFPVDGLVADRRYKLICAETESSDATRVGLEMQVPGGVQR